MPTPPSTAWPLFAAALALLVLGNHAAGQATAPAIRPATQPSFQARMDAFDRLDAKSPPPAHPVVFIGASTFTRWNEIPETFKEFDAINRAFGGSNLAQLIEHLDQIVIRYKPRAVVIYGGNSDMGAQTDPAQVLATYQRLTDQIQAALPETEIFCLSVIPAPSRANVHDKLERFNALLREHAARHPHMHFIDARFALSDAEHKPDPANYVEDRLHPNAAGYAKLTPVIREALRAVLRPAPATGPANRKP